MSTFLSCNMVTSIIVDILGLKVLRQIFDKLCLNFQDTVYFELTHFNLSILDQTLQSHCFAFDFI